MATHWTAKAANEARYYTWEAPLADGDSIASYIATVSAGGVTIEEDEDDGAVVTLLVSGGTNDTQAVIAISAVTTEGEDLSDTIYLPILATANDFAETGRDIADFALRKVIGNGNTADATELDDALERLSDMLASWKGQGADLGVVLPVVASTVFYVPDSFMQAIKNNLIVELADLYEFQPSPRVVMNAARGLQQIKTALLPSDREGADYY